MKFWSTTNGRLTFAHGSEWVCECLARSGLTLIQWQQASFYPGKIGITPTCQIASTELKPRIPEGHLWYDAHEGTTPHASWEEWFRLKFYQRIYYWFHKSYRNPDGSQYKKPEVCEWPGTKNPFGPLRVSSLSAPTEIVEIRREAIVAAVSTVSLVTPLPRRRPLSPEEREAIRQLTGNLCMYCRVPIGEGQWEYAWDVDHVINFKDHPEFDALPNFGPSCFECNSHKRDMPFATFLVSPWLLDRQRKTFEEMKKRRRPGRNGESPDMLTREDRSVTQVSRGMQFL